MAKPKEAVRNYSISDADMAQASRLMQGSFTEDLAVFSAFDSSFADPFTANWLLSINNSNNIVRDTIALGQQTELTGIVEKTMEEARNLFQSMKYFIEKAFPGKKEIWAQFGYNDYLSARNSETKMIQFLGVLYNTAVTHKDQLIAAGFIDGRIESIKSLQTQLAEADYNQEKAKKARPAVTHERIAALNDCYSYMQKVSKAAKIIFANDYVKYNRYLLPNERAEKKVEETTPPPSPNN